MMDVPSTKRAAKRAGPALLLFLLAACQHAGSNAPQPAPAAVPTSPGIVLIYRCVPTEAAAITRSTPGQSVKIRQLLIALDAASKRLRLNVDGGPPSFLDPVANSNGTLYANASFAWKAAGDGAQLTDIAEVRLYDCARSASPQAASLSATLRP